MTRTTHIPGYKNKLETVMRTRDVPWMGANIGTVVDEAQTADEAIKLAGLDWKVSPKPIVCDGIVVPDRVGNVREYYDYDTPSVASFFDTDDGGGGQVKRNVLGIVSPRYKVVQNEEAFDFFDNLIGTEAKYETAGSIDNGRQIFLTAKMQKEWRIADDDIETYFLLMNGHDGYHPLRAAITPVRLVCNNMLYVAFKSAIRSWTLYHYKNITDKIKEARHALEISAQYMETLVDFGNRAADKKVSPETIEALTEELLTPEGKAKRSKETFEKRKSIFEKCLFAPDIKQYRGTAWGVLNAVSDYETHYIGTPTGRMKRTMNDQLKLLNRAKDFLYQTV